MASDLTDRLAGVRSSLAIKAPVRVATTANITLSGLQTIDSVALAANDRVLVKDQTTGAQNGIYVASTGTWQRAKDWDGSGDAVTGTMVLVTDGSTNPGRWAVATSGSITIGTTSVTFEAEAALAVGDGSVTYAKIQDVSATQRVLARDTAGAGSVEEVAISDILDWLGTTQGSMLYRGASGWNAIAPGTSGQYLKTTGAGSDPTWATPAGGGDMLTAIYDPTGVVGDAFDMDNMTEGSTNLILTAAERAAIVDLAYCAADGSGAVSRTIEGKLRETLSVLDFIPENLHATIAARTETTDLQTYVDAATAAAALQNKSLLFPGGKYRISGYIDIDNVDVSGDGMQDTYIESVNTTATEPIVCMGRSASLSNLCLSYHSSVMTGSESDGERCAIITYSLATGRVLQRGGVIRNVRIDTCGTGVSDGGASGGSFSATYESIEITNFSYRGWDFQSTERTGNSYSNIYIHGGDGEGTTNSAYSGNIDCGFILDGSESECVIDQLNVEWIHCLNAIRLTSVNAGQIGSIHLEQVTLRTDYNPLVEVDQCSMIVDALTVYYCPIEIDGWSIVRVRDATYATPGTSDPNTAGYLEIGTLNTVGLNGGLKVLSGAGVGSLTDFYFVSRESADVGPFRVHINNFNWNTFRSDSATIAAFPADPHNMIAFTGPVGPLNKSARSITSNQDDYNSLGTLGLDTIRVTTDTTRFISGFNNPWPGRVLTVINSGSNRLVMSQETTSTAEYRIIGFGYTVIPPGGAARLWYDGIALRWRVVALVTCEFLDDTFRVRDNSDTSKILQLQLSGITTHTTRTLTVPDKSGTIAIAGDYETEVVKSADETIQSDATNSDDAELLFAMAANSKYKFSGRVFFDTTGAADFKYSFSGPSSPTLIRIAQRAVAAGATSFALNRTDTTYTGAAVTGTGTNGGYVEFEGIVHNGANAGNFVFQWAQNTSTAADTVVRAGSWMKYKSF